MVHNMYIPSRITPGELLYGMIKSHQRMKRRVKTVKPDYSNKTL